MWHPSVARVLLRGQRDAKIIILYTVDPIGQGELYKLFRGLQLLLYSSTAICLGALTIQWILLAKI